MPTNVDIPAMGESITEAVLVRWMKADGDLVQRDEPICELETDKANFDLPAPESGVLHPARKEGDSVRVGETIGRIDEAADTSQAKAKPTPVKAEPEAKAKPTPAKAEPAPMSDATPKRPKEETNSTVAKTPAEEPPERIERQPARESEPHAVPAVPATEYEPKKVPSAAENTRRVPMSKIRRRIAEHLVAAQQQTAMLTTFNEIDMSAVLDLRGRYKAGFEEKYGVSLGLMSFFAKATVLALSEFAVLNAQIDGSDVVYHDYVNLGVAVSTDRGLVVPVIHNIDSMPFGQIEAEIKRVAIAAREGKLQLAELSGGTFTITNGGVFGSLLSTPILNHPQCGILGMHAIQKRPMVWNDRIEIRPMMYAALTYDHRLVDGSDSVRFLVRVKQLLEDPSRMLLGI
jgi:2-oxoglutarate dehydrogenase E2 component (dihydrolipoamide succinyltransferase)